MSGWERLAGAPGGTVGAFSTAKSSSGDALVFAVTMTGAFVSGDGGCTWVRTARGHNIPFCEVIATSAEFGRDHTLFIGGREGLYRSTDAGATWLQVLRGERVLCAVSSRGVLLVGTELDGILRSEDAARSFAPANAGLLDLAVLALAVSPHFEHDGTAFAATASGLYRTRNGGKLWRLVELDSEVAVQCVAISPRFADDGLVLAGTESAGLLRSEDGGLRWERVAESRDRSVTAVTFSSREISAAFASDVGIAISNDAGRSWRAAASDLGISLSLCFAPFGGGEALLAGLHRNGVLRSLDPFEHFEPANSGLQARLVLDVALSPTFDADQTLFAAGPDAGVMRSEDGGRTWTASLSGFDDPLVFGVAVSPNFPRDRMVFAASEAGVFRSRDVGATWQPVLEGTPVAHIVAGPLRDDRGWPLLAATTSANLLLSEDAGAVWRALGDGFAGAEIVCAAFSPDYWRDHTLFVGTAHAEEVTLWRSVDDGVRWRRWLVERGEGLLPLVVPNTYPLNGVLYAARGTRILRPMRDTREVHSGEQRPMWRGVDVGVPVAALALSNGGVGFAGTSQGVFISRDNFEQFSQSTDPTAPGATLALAVSAEGSAYALELGGTTWRYGSSAANSSAGERRSPGKY